MQAKKTILAASAALALLPALARAADYYLQRNQGQGWSWHTVSAGTGWFPAPKGYPSISAIDPDGTYHTNGFQLRTKEVNGRNEVDRFPGARLVIDGGPNASLAVKAQGSAVARADNVVSAGGTFFAASGNRPQNLHIGTLEQSGNTTFAATFSGRGYNLTIDRLAGDGEIRFAERQIDDRSTRFHLNIKDASAYAGAFVFSGGKLRFDGDLDAPKASLELPAGADVDLNGKTVRVAALKIGGKPLPQGAYSAG